MVVLYYCIELNKSQVLRRCVYQTRVHVLNNTNKMSPKIVRKFGRKIIEKILCAYEA